MRAAAAGLFEVCLVPSRWSDIAVGLTVRSQSYVAMSTETQMSILTTMAAAPAPAVAPEPVPEQQPAPTAEGEAPPPVAPPARESFENE